MLRQENETHSEHFRMGEEAARRLWTLGLDAGSVTDPLTQDFAEGALQEFERLQEGTAGVLRQVLEGAQISAEQLNVGSFHGLIEVVQNADDLGASEIGIAVRRANGRQTLLVVHNGERVRLDHVLAMALAFISTKRDDPSSKGRFGIGLKTLGRLGHRLTVHCPPYHFTIEDNRVCRARPSVSIGGLYDHTANQTLLTLDLSPEFDLNAFRHWFVENGAQSLLFLDAVRHLKMIDLRKKKTITHHEMRVTSTEPDVGLPGLSEPCRCTILKEPKTRRWWTRYDSQHKVPQGLQRRYKAIGETTPISVALPGSPNGGGRLYAGLPVGEGHQLPFSLNAQFDVDTSRRSVQHDRLNEWLFARLADLASAVALYLFQSRPAEAWQAVPLHQETAAANDPWLSAQFAELADAIKQRVGQRAQITLDGKARRLRELVYEDSALSGLIGEREATGLRPKLVFLPTPCRDHAERWRSVLTELEESTVIDTGEAVSLFDWEDKDLSHRDVRWFVRLAHVAINEGLGPRIAGLRSVITNDDQRLVPPVPGQDGAILLKTPKPRALATRLGLARAVHPIYLSSSPYAASVRKWLEEEGRLADLPEAETTLRAIAARDPDAPVIALKDPELMELREALEAVPAEVAAEVGPAIGRVVAVDVQVWRGIKKRQDIVRPCDAYLPASIEDRADGWSRAASATSGIAWVHPRYEKLLQRKGTKRSHSTEKRRLASRAFFRLLGTEIAPRLVQPPRAEERYGDPAHPIAWPELSESQRQALQSLPRQATHLKGDWVAPELVAVLSDISSERKVQKRSVRARALLSTLEREWTRLYADHLSTTAVYSSYSWNVAGTVPTSWIAYAMDIAWLTNEAGQPSAPCKLAVRTPAMEAIYGDDRHRFARELEPSDAATPVLRALRVEADPQVSELVDQLERIRRSGEVIPPSQLDLRYAAIAAASTKREPGPDERVGDLTVKQLRARFGAQRNLPGLIFVNGRWLPPSQVFLGPPIFGTLRPFVPAKSPANPLWRILHIKPPSLTHCIELLEEIAGSEDEVPDQQKILVSTYAHIEDNLKEASARERRALARLPLWIGKGWARERPVYVTTMPGLVEALSDHVPMWHSLIGPESIPHLIEAIQVTPLATESFIPVVGQDAFTTGADVEHRFRLAVRLLEDWLARHDRELAHANTVPWESMASARTACDPDLQIELNRKGHASIAVVARAYVQRDPLTFYFADADAIAEEDAGHVVASLFERGDRAKLALAWSQSWAKAGKGYRAIVGIEEEQTQSASLVELFAQAKAQKGRGRTAQVPARRRRDETGVQPITQQIARQLKTIEQFEAKSVDLSPEHGSTGRATGRRGGLRAKVPSGRDVGEVSTPVPRTSPIAYSPEEKESLALHVLQVAINGEAAALKDYRHLRGVGADARDKLKRYFEIKAFYGPVQDDVTMTANEAERALQEKDKFFLAVIGGLERGYETVVKIFPDPLRSLKIKRDTSVRLTGVARKAPLEVRFPKD